MTYAFSGNKYEKDLETKKTYCIFRENYFIMIILVAQYLLVGVVIALCLELFIRAIGEEVGHMERIQLIVAWPLMAAVFIYNFIKGMFS